MEVIDRRSHVEGDTMSQDGQGCDRAS